MKITTIVRFGVAALVMGASFGVGLPVKADQLVWVRAQQLDYFRARGLTPPGSYFLFGFLFPHQTKEVKPNHQVNLRMSEQPVNPPVHPGQPFNQGIWPDRAL
jgi:hypothetical protein